MFPLQFQTPGLHTLSETYGEASPMGLLWTFMGASMAYTIFAGLAEVTGGLLLLFSRTTMLGALISAAVLLNIVMLNFCYDVPVKLYSMHLLAIALFLLLPDFSALSNFFLRHRSGHPASLKEPGFSRQLLRRTALAVKVLLVASVLYGNVSGGIASLRHMEATKRWVPIRGLWMVDSFSRGGQEVPALPSDSTRWKQLIIEYPGYASGLAVNNSPFAYRMNLKPAEHKIVFIGFKDKSKNPFTYSQPDKNHLALTGTLHGQPVLVQLHLYDESKFLLTHRGFHWLSEDPYNR